MKNPVPVIVIAQLFGTSLWFSANSAADDLTKLLNRICQRRGRFQNGENELKDIHGIFQPDDDNGEPNASGYEADDFFDGFHGWCGVLSVW